MEVRKWMKHPVHTVKLLDSIQHAREIMSRYGVNQLPVLVDSRLVGIITDRDIRDVFPSVFDSPDLTQRKPAVATADPSRIPVEMAMTGNVMTVSPGDSIVTAVRLMRKNRIGALPVVDEDHIVGILARSDILDAFTNLVELEDRREGGIELNDAAARARNARKK